EVQQHMVKLGWCRRYINQAIGLIRACWKWGARKEIIPFAFYDRLRTVPGLRQGRTEAPDHAPRLHVDDALVEQTLPHLPRPGQGLVQFQGFTGARPGEAVTLRPMDIDQDAFVVDGVKVWVYRPESHKGQWRGHWRALPIGPRCQEMLASFLTRK